MLVGWYRGHGGDVQCLLVFHYDMHSMHILLYLWMQYSAVVWFPHQQGRDHIHYTSTINYVLLLCSYTNLGNVHVYIVCVCVCVYVCVLNHTTVCQCIHTSYNGHMECRLLYSNFLNGKINKKKSAIRFHKQIRDTASCHCYSVTLKLHSRNASVFKNFVNIGIAIWKLLHIR